MASNGVILLNLENRNAAEFQRLSVPDSYEKASGALTSGTYVTVYKWLYDGFMLAPSLCDAVDATDHINLVDRTNGGVISVYPDDTITLEGIVPTDDLMTLTVSSNGVYYPPEGKRGFSSVRANVEPHPHPIMVSELNVIENGTWIAPFGYDGFNPVNVNVVVPPEERNFKAYRLSTGSTTSPYSIRVQKGHYVATEFSTDFDPDDMILDGDEIEVTTSMCTGINTPYILEGCVSIAYVGGWIIRATQFAHQYMLGIGEWVYFSAGTLLEEFDSDSPVNLFFCEDSGSTSPVVEPIIYTNIGSGLYAPYLLDVDSSRQVALIGSTTYTKNNSTEVYAAVCQSSLGYKAILLACKVEDHVQEDTRFSPGGTGTSTATVEGINYYYSWATGISGDYNQGPAKWSDITGGSWDTILNLLLNEIVKSANVPAPAYAPDTTGFIPVPEGYDGFGPLLII